MAYKQKSDKTRTARKSKAGKTIYGIIGMGRFGLALAQELHAADADLIIVDKDEEKINLARELTENAFIVRNLERRLCWMREWATATWRWSASGSILTLPF